MKLLEKLLVGVEFGPTAPEVLDTAVFVAKHFSSEVILLHVVPGVSERYSDAIAMIRTDVEMELQEAVERVRAGGIDNIQTVVDFGIPYDLILQHANQKDVNAIILGAREKSQNALGTTAAEVRRGATKPVWLVKPGSSLPVKSVLCPVDFSEASGRAMRNVIHVARCFDANLAVLTVAPCSSSAHDMEKIAAEARRAGVEPESVLMDHYARDFDLHGVRWTKFIRKGKPHEEILKVVDEIKADLLVMGSAGRKGLARMLMGGLARKLASEMPCSIVTVRSEHAFRPRVEPQGGDLDEFFKQGHELLALGFPEEAGRQFRQCLAKDKKFVPAWEGLAAVSQRLGRDDEARQYLDRAEQAAQEQYHKQVEADVREQHFLFRSMFGAKDKE
ncbi:MAG: universal stress protein [Pirellulaceae bacterium]|nr:universal stress protein [Pirellulaceae bacterium]